MNCKALLFDLDGTLVDTAADFVKVLNEQREYYGLTPLDPLVIRNTVSNGARALTHLAFGGNEGESDFERKRQELLDRYMSAVGAEATLFKGMPEVIKACNQRSIPWGIITNKPRVFTDLLLKRILIGSRPLFELSSVTLCPDDVSRAKPDPESLLLAAARLNLPTHQCAYVGDHERDIIAGKAAKMITVAAKYGYIDDQINVELWNSDHYIAKPIDLLSLFLK